MQLIAKFAAVGVINTGVDFAVFNLLFAVVRLPLLVANICAASVAMVISLQLNKNFVFRAESEQGKWQAMRFLAVTLSGVYVLQNVVIYSSIAALHALHAGGAHVVLVADVAKVTGIMACAAWNFTWYRLWVFRLERVEQTTD